MRKLILSLAFGLWAGLVPAAGTVWADPAAAHPPKGFDKKNAKEHLLKHQNYPATKAELVASCNGLADFSAEDKKWFSASLPEGSYASAAQVMKALGIN